VQTGRLADPFEPLEQLSSAIGGGATIRNPGTNIWYGSQSVDRLRTGLRYIRTFISPKSPVQQSEECSLCKATLSAAGIRLRHLLEKFCCLLFVVYTSIWRFWKQSIGISMCDIHEAWEIFL